MQVTHIVERSHDTVGEAVRVPHQTAVSGGFDVMIE